MLLVGDSLGCVVQGQPNTLAVTMDEMIYHTRLSRVGANARLLISDMPFLSYQSSREQALQNAGRFLKGQAPRQSSSKAESRCARRSTRSSKPAFRSWATSG